jgi:hypothetical protein
LQKIYIPKFPCCFGSEQPAKPAPYSPGVTVAAIARQLGVSRSWASREANAPGTKILITKLFEAKRERINAVFDRTLDLIEDALQARNTLVVNGAVVDAGARSLRADRGGEAGSPAASSGKVIRSDVPGDGRERARRAQSHPRAGGTEMVEVV